jgi:6-phosphogluconolactonase
MMTQTSLLLDFKTREDASQATAELAQNALFEGLRVRGKASLAVSGGSTPGPMFDTLSKADIDWASVSIGLVDERCVPPDHDASNERLVRRTLLQHKAAKADFLPLWSRVEQFTQDANRLYTSRVPFDFVLLGMGNDGHTASWFPGAKNLSDALDDREQAVVSIDAAGCPVAGEITNRLTMTRRAISSAKHAVLLIFGDEKRRVFETAMTKPINDFPVRAAVEGLGQRLVVCWAP